MSKLLERIADKLVGGKLTKTIKKHETQEQLILTQNETVAMQREEIARLNKILERRDLELEQLELERDHFEYKFNEYFPFKVGTRVIVNGTEEREIRGDDQDGYFIVNEHGKPTSLFYDSIQDLINAFNSRIKLK